MKGDPGSNYTIALNYAITQEATGTYYTTALDHGLAPSAVFHVSCNEFLTSFVATLQWSDASDSGFADEADDTAGNDVSLTLEATGSGNVKAPNPRGRYSRLKIVIGGQSTFGVTSVLGPLRSIAPA